ncbi:MAG: tol-pal system protein YbgF [Candidatus Aminicenantes bacterium]|nr:MAG: tol-pal system protein YbgF [Candidatus Aminicenantes bacterium]
MSKRLIGISLILLLPLVSAGTDKKQKTYELIYKDVQLLRQQFLQLKKQIDKNTEDINFIKGQLEELLKLSKLLQSEQASFKQEQRKIPAQSQVFLEKLELMSLQLTKLSEELIEIKRASLIPSGQTEEKSASQDAESSPPEKKVAGQKEEEQLDEEIPTPPTAMLSPAEVFNMAYSDYRNGNFELAIDGFKMYKEQFPESPLVDDSLYWIGECYFSQKKHEEAIEQFNELILNYSRGDKIPAAYLKKGLSLAELGKKEEALAVFKLLVSKYPLEEETKIAQQKIKELKSENERY